MLSLLGVLLASAACGGSTEPANDPSHTTSAPTMDGGPPEATPVEGTKPTSGAPAPPAEGKCKSGAPAAGLKDLDSCMASCKGLDDAVPPGSRCISAKNACLSQCNTTFGGPAKKP